MTPTQRGQENFMFVLLPEQLRSVFRMIFAHRIQNNAERRMVGLFLNHAINQLSVSSVERTWSSPSPGAESAFGKSIDRVDPPTTPVGSSSRLDSGISPGPNCLLDPRPCGRKSRSSGTGNSRCIRLCNGDCVTNVVVQGCGFSPVCFRCG